MAACLWGASASLGKAMFNGSMLDASLPRITPVLLAQSRTTISLLLLAPVILLWRGRQGFALPAREILRCMLLGTAGLAASNYFYYLSIERTTVGTAIILQYVAPVWVLLYMVTRGLQRATAARVIAVFLAVIGSALAIGALSAGGAFPYFRLAGLRLDLLGVIAAEIAAVSFAFYNIYGQSLVARHDRWKVLTYALLGSALFWMVINPPWRIAQAGYTGRQWMLLGVFAVSSMLLPFSFYFSGLRYLDATRAIVTSCLEPVFAILFAAMFVGEHIGAMQVAGMVCVLAATVLIQKPEEAASA